MNPVLQILALLLLILLGGVLAMSEIAMVSARQARLRRRAEEGHAGARRALELAASPGRFLSTVQIGITLVGILAGAFGGATLAAKLAPSLTRIDLLEPYARPLSVGLVVLLVTYLSLVLGELVPKRIGLGHAERVAAAVAPAMHALSRLAAPLVAVLSASTNAVLRLLRVPTDDGTPVTDEEIQILLQQGTEVGVFEPIEEEIVEQLFRLSDRQVASLLTPRGEIVWLDPDDGPQALLDKLERGGHSRYPVARHSLDRVLGVVLVKDLVEQQLAGRDIDLLAAMQPAVFVPDGTPALDLLERFRETQSKLALVVDEFGSLLGLVTVNDLLEAMVGELPEIGDSAQPEATRREDGSWLLDGLYPIDELESLLGLRHLGAAFEGRYHTVGGLAMTALGRVPSSGDHFTTLGYRFEVVDMDGRRVDKVLAGRVEDGGAGS